MEYQVQENCLTIYLPAEVDHHNAEEMKRKADKLIDRNHIKYVIFDFENTDFMDSSGIGVIMGRYKTISLIGGEVWAVHTNARIRKILTLSGVTKIMQIYEEEEEMTPANEMELKFDSRSANEGFARVAVAAFMTQLNPTVEEVADVKTAVSEAVTNVIIHGYEKEVRKVYIKCMIEENIFTVEVCDQGKGIENIEEAMCPMYTTRPDQDRSGMGFAFMEAFMDSVEVESELGKGTRVRMKKAVGKGRDIWTTQSL